MNTKLFLKISDFKKADLPMDFQKVRKFIDSSIIIAK